MTQKRSNRHKTSSKPLLVLVVCALTVVVVLAALELTNTTNLFNKQKPTPTTGSQNTKGEPSTDTKNPQQPTPNPGTPDTGASTDPKDQNEPSPSTNKPLIAPSGVFASSHHISLATNPSVQSTCETTADATCQITFTKDGVVKQLEAKTADTGGGVYWTWKPQAVGLTAGSWHIQAKATNASETKTTDDSLTLEVTP